MKQKFKGKATKALAVMLAVAGSFSAFSSAAYAGTPSDGEYGSTDRVCATETVDPRFVGEYIFVIIIDDSYTNLVNTDSVCSDFGIETYSEGSTVYTRRYWELSGLGDVGDAYNDSGFYSDRVVYTIGVDGNGDWDGDCDVNQESGTFYIEVDFNQDLNSDCVWSRPQ